MKWFLRLHCLLLIAMPITTVLAAMELLSYPNKPDTFADIWFFTGFAVWASSIWCHLKLDDVQRSVWGGRTDG